MSHIALATDELCQLVLDMGYFDLLDSVDTSEFLSASNEIADIYSTVFYICTRYYHRPTPTSINLFLEKGLNITNRRQGNEGASF